MMKRLRFYYSVVFLLVSIVLSAFSVQERYPQGFKILEHEGYAVCYSGRDRLPIWVFERLSETTLQKQTDRQNHKFVANPDVPNFHQAVDADYSYSGYDKGHMAAATNHEYSNQGMEETFFYTNACPQNPNCNRGIWKKLEQTIKATLKDSRDDRVFFVDVYSGPLFLSQADGDKKYVKYDLLGESEVAIPTEFFKVIYYRAEDETLKFREGYIIPNREIRNANLEDFKEDVERIERVTGLIFPTD